ncbi:hypothetical protein CSE16_13085 [Solibacillus sp. R5-41]|uniref:helix-turn-helix transcriptional regulator n=1 Tax=Solibacillus sp. R5-41 TaxID=2048654 RepID=UPI000C12585C|nr:YafY family protein [Solibacillus sp. R5-41]ATP40906.1 hypothetical protein CSE16_13085 [Solibacillus sp. R5-41]
MKIERLLKIIFILLNKQKVTAEEVAKHLAVSTRTVYRDMDTLSLAGFPIYAERGNFGGYRLIEGYYFPHSYFTEEDLRLIKETLTSTMTLHTDKPLQNILAKITLLNESKTENSIDFSFLNNKDGVKVTDIRQAIKDKKCLTFSYAKKEQLETKKVKPIQVFFYHLSWYMFGWPENETKPKFYRLSRIHELNVGNAVFTESFEHLDGYQEFSNWMKSLESEIVKIELILRFPLTSSQEVFDSFPETNIDKSSVDHLLVRISYPDEEWVVKLILSFGSQVEVLSPKSFKNKIMAQIEKMTRIYFT